MHLGSEHIERHGLYILDDGQDIYIWVGAQIHPELCQLIFGCAPAQLNVGQIELPVLENPWSRRLGNILASQRMRNGSNPSTFVYKEESQDTAERNRFLSRLIEDKGPDTQPSYSLWTTNLRDKIYSSK